VKFECAKGPAFWSCKPVMFGKVKNIRANICLPQTIFVSYVTKSETIKFISILNVDKQNT